MNKAFKFLWEKFEIFVRFVMGFLLKLGGINWKEEQWENFLQFVKFCMVGLSSAIVMYLSYYISYVLSDNYIFANCIGFIFSTTNSFVWNNLIVFERQIGGIAILQAYLKAICLYAATGLVLSNILLYVWVDKARISELIAPVINVIIVTPLNYVLNKLWAFQKS